MQSWCPASCAALLPPITPRTGEARPPGSRKTRKIRKTPGPWSGWPIRGRHLSCWPIRGQGADGASVGARTAVTGSVSTCGTVWCTCRKRDRGSAWHVSDVMWRDQDRHREMSDSARFNYFHTEVWLWHLCEVSPRQPIRGRHLSWWPIRVRCEDNSAWQRDKPRRTEELTLAASFESGPVTCDELCRKNVPGAHSCPSNVPLSLSRFRARGIICCQFDIWLDHCDSHWSWLTLIEANNIEQDPHCSLSGNQREPRNSLERRLLLLKAAVCLFIPEAKPVIFSSSHFHFIQCRSRNENQYESDCRWMENGASAFGSIEGEAPLDLSHVPALSPGSPPLYIPSNSGIFM